MIILYFNDTVKSKISKLFPLQRLMSLATAFLWKQSIPFRSARVIFRIKKLDSLIIIFF